MSEQAGGGPGAASPASLTVWTRKDRAFWMKVLSTAFLIIQLPLWVEACRLGAMSLAGLDSGGFFGLMAMKPLVFPVNLAVLILGAAATVADIAYGIWLWVHGQLLSVSLEPAGLVKRYDGLGAPRVTVAWADLGELSAKAGPNGMMIQAAGPKKKTSIVTIPYGSDADAVVAQIQRYREGRQ